MNDDDDNSSKFEPKIKNKMNEPVRKLKMYK